MGKQDDGNLRLSFRCSRQWSQLSPIAGEPDVRYCTSCRAAVHRVRTQGEFQQEAAAGHCVALKLGRDDYLVGDPLPRQSYGKQP
jgi:hypothetical protein